MDGWWVEGLVGRVGGKAGIAVWRYGGWVGKWVRRWVGWWNLIPQICKNIMKTCSRMIQISIAIDQNGAWVCFESDVKNRSVPGTPQITRFNKLFMYYVDFGQPLGGPWKSGGCQKRTKKMNTVTLTPRSIPGRSKGCFERGPEKGIDFWLDLGWFLS